MEPGWVPRGGVDWLLLPADPRSVSVGGMVDAGLADQEWAAHGVAELTARVLHRELARPVEQAAGQVDQADVHVELGATTLVVNVRGSAALVRAVWQRFGGLLRGDDPVEVDRSDLAAVGADVVPLHGWGEDLALRFGPTPLAFAAVTRLALGTLDADAVGAFLRRLDPAAGRHRWVCWTSDPDLMGSALGAPAPAAPRVVDRGPDRRGSVPAPHGILLSGIVPAGAAGRVAAGLLADSLTTGLVHLRRLASEVRVTGHRLGNVSWLVAVVADPGLPREDLGGPLAGILQDVPFVADDVVRRAIDAHAAESDPRLLDAAADRLAGVGPGPVPPAQVRDVLLDLVASVHLAVDPDAEPHDGFPALVPAAGPPRGHRFGTWHTAPDTWFRTLRRHTLGTHGFWVEVRAAKGRSWHPMSVVDPRALAVVVEEGAELTHYWDASLRSVTVAWPLLRRPGALRRRLAPARAAAPTLPLPAAESGPAYRRAGRAAKIKAALLAALVGVALLAGGLGLVQAFAVDPTTTAGVPLGQQVALSNGTTITVSDRFERATDPGPVVTATVRFCAGGDTRSGRSSPEARRYVGPEKFALVAGGLTTPSNIVVGDVRLPATVLAPGACAEGRVSFRSAGPPTDPAIRYTNLLGDEITWR